MRIICYLTRQCLCHSVAGLEDMVLSALVQEQVEGITPEAIALMSPKKMAVSFNHNLLAIHSNQCLS